MAQRRTSRRDPAAARRHAQAVGLAGVVVAAALPVCLWHDVITDIAHVSRLDLTGVFGWIPWALMALGLLCTAPIAVEHLRDRERRFHRRGTGAWAGWAITLYLLGFALATQVAQIHDLHT